jgi:hypothetical protein
MAGTNDFRHDQMSLSEVSVWIAPEHEESKMKIAKTTGLILAFSTLVVLAPPSANADRRDDGRHDGHGDIRDFHNRDLPRWRAGNWHHGAHEGRLGWWWVVGGLWYFYPRPVYPYPDAYTPPVVVVPQTSQPVMPGPAPQAQNWYFCPSANGYYPYVPSCPEGWRMVPATPPGVPAQ